MGDLTLKNIIGYRKEADGNNFETAAVPFLLLQTFSSKQSVDQFSNEFQILGKNGTLDYIIGAFYFRELGTDRSDTYVLSPTATVLDGHARNISYSAFAHFDYDASPIGLEGLGFSGGLRINHDKRYFDYRNRRGTTLGPAPAQFICLLNPAMGVNNGSACHYPVSINFTEPTWDVGLNYKVHDNALIYATISQGYRTGGFSSGAASVSAATPYRPEKVHNYEIGSKNDFTIAQIPVRINVAGFYTDYKDIQRTITNLSPAGIYVNSTINAASAHIIGAEFETTIKPTHALTLTASYTYLKPSYDSFTDTYIETGPAYTGGAASKAFPVDVSDSQFILISRHSIGATLDYRFPQIQGIGTPTFNANYYYRTGFHTTSDINTPNCTVPGDKNPSAFYANCYNHSGRLPGYGLLNLRFSIEDFLRPGLNLAVFVNNVTNNYYYSNAANALSAFGTQSAYIGAPRMFGFQLRYAFQGQ